MEPEAVLRLVVVGMSTTKTSYDTRESPKDAVCLDSSKREPYKKLKELVLKFVLPAVQEAKRNFEQAEGAVTIDKTLALPEVPQQPVDKLALPPLEDELDTTTTLEETPTEDIYHEAYCNHCGHDIYNLRYKCANCDDFDLVRYVAFTFISNLNLQCEECELAWSSDFSIHDISHVFLKLYRPISPSYTTAFLSQNLYEEEHKEEEDEEESDSSESDSSSSDEEDEEETESSSESESDESEESEDDKFELPEVKDTEVSEVDAASLEEDAENVVTEENLIEASHEEEEDEQAEEKEEQEKEETPAPTTESEPKKKESSGFFRALQRFFAMAEESKFSREEYEAFLVDMGFSDKERNIKLLEQSDDNIHDVLDQLVA